MELGSPVRLVVKHTFLEFQQNGQQEESGTTSWTNFRRASDPGMERGLGLEDMQGAQGGGFFTKDEAADDASDSGSGLSDADSDFERALKSPMRVGPAGRASREVSPGDGRATGRNSRRGSNVSQQRRCSLSTDDGFGGRDDLHPQLLQNLRNMQKDGAGRRWSYATEDGFGSRRSSVKGDEAAAAAARLSVASSVGLGSVGGAPWPDAAALLGQPPPNLGPPGGLLPGGIGGLDSLPHKQRLQNAAVGKPGLAARREMGRLQVQPEPQLNAAQIAEAAHAAQLARAAAVSSLHNPHNPPPPASVTAQLTAQLQAMQALQRGWAANPAALLAAGGHPVRPEIPTGLDPDRPHLPVPPPAGCPQFGAPQPNGGYPAPWPGNGAPLGPNNMWWGPPHGMPPNYAQGLSSIPGANLPQGGGATSQFAPPQMRGGCPLPPGQQGRRGSRGSQTTVSSEKPSDMLDTDFDIERARTNGEPMTTLMLRNLPEEYSRDMLTELLNAEGFQNLYDFIYVPMSFRSRLSFGYAFVNLVSQEAIELCRQKFTGFTAWKVPSSKICEVSWSNMHQGLSAHIERYRNSPVMHESIPDPYKPAVFQNGVRVAFPPPTKRIRAPRVRRSQEEGEELDMA
mmetsp:Transcript_51050/g.94413  ORF Transcript_51050/g.94413 Transcript_51050/m.94413 type:complete len:625 (+) Transcript_51050:95-1969(+)